MNVEQAMQGDFAQQGGSAELVMIRQGIVSTAPVGSWLAIDIAGRYTGASTESEGWQVPGFALYISDLKSQIPDGDTVQFTVQQEGRRHENNGSIPAGSDGIQFSEPQNIPIHRQVAPTALTVPPWYWVLDKGGRPRHTTLATLKASSAGHRLVLDAKLDCTGPGWGSFPEQSTAKGHKIEFPVFPMVPSTSPHGNAGTAILSLRLRLL